MNEFNQAFETLPLVDDLALEGDRIVLICESPHKDEIRCGYPLAGSAGVKVTKGLVNGLKLGTDTRFVDRPIGRIIKNLPDAGCPSDLPHIFRHLGIMNVSRVAMQESAYPNSSNLGSVRRTLFDAFRTLRANPKAESRKKSRVMCIEERMVADFRARLKKLDDDTSVVLCGTVARAYFCKAGGPKMSSCVYPDGLSHPSARQKNTWLIKKEMKALIRWMLHRAPSAN